MFKVMKMVSIHRLKAQLSGTIAEAEAGTTVLITRHNEPVAVLGPANVRRVHRGARVGSGRLTPALERGTRGRALMVLAEDRAER